MEGSLRDETVGKGNAEETCNAGGEAQEKDIPVEASWFMKRKLCPLGDEGGDYFVLATILTSL